MISKLKKKKSKEKFKNHKDILSVEKWNKEMI